MCQSRDTFGDGTEQQPLHASSPMRGQDNQLCPHRIGMFGNPMTGITEVDAQLQISIFLPGERFLELFEGCVSPLRVIDRCPQCIRVRRLWFVEDAQDVNVCGSIGDLQRNIDGRQGLVGHVDWHYDRSL
jgi:hypothetical protein